MFRICVISDTHVHTLAQIPLKVVAALSGVDLIIHAGDFTDRAVLDELRMLGTVRAVHGNMDSSELKMLLPARDAFSYGGIKIGLAHGSGAPWGIDGRVRAMFADEDVIIFGHSHVSCNKVVKGSIMFNPGAARHSYGILTIDDEVREEIIRV